MKKLQNNTVAKVCVWIVLMCAAFGTGVFGVRVVLSFGSVADENWQTSSRYYKALDNRRWELFSMFELYHRLNTEQTLLNEQLARKDSGTVSYAEVNALQQQLDREKERFSRQNTWFRFRLLDSQTREILYTNLLDQEAISQAVWDVSYFSFDLLGLESYYGLDYYNDLRNSYSNAAADGRTSGQAKLMLEYGLPGEVNSSVKDEFYQIWKNYEVERTSFNHYLTGFFCMGVLTLAALLWVLWSAGHRSGMEGIVTTWQERIFFDVYALAAIASMLFVAACTIWTTERLYWELGDAYAAVNEEFTTFIDLGVLGAGALFAAGVMCVTLLLRTLTVRLKARMLGKTTLICRVWGWTVRTVHDFLRFLPFTWKMVLGFGVYVLFTLWLVMLGRDDGVFMLIYFCLQVALTLFLAWWSYGYYRLRQGTKTIAKGDLEYQIDTKRMPYDLRMQAEDLNNISVGLAGAVDEKMKSERFKAELITNVSHDLKTPLTSIINYVNLLKSTSQTDPKAVEYIEVLDRKSQRLKKLTEDLVEASKASTGVLSVTREKIGMAQLVDQALAEWEERLEAQKLTLVTTLPEGETWVYADGRHLWRVIDNLLSNCAKYALEGTRVYLDLERGKGQVVLSVKNISREPLNVPAERLMERFIRGEESRSTEGSGLGLSIARSLTELQGGTFELAVDGDLFKAIVTLPQAN